MTWASLKMVPLQLNREMAKRSGKTATLMPEPQSQLNRTKLKGSERTNLMRKSTIKKGQPMRSLESKEHRKPRRDWHNQYLAVILTQKECRRDFFMPSGSSVNKFNNRKEESQKPLHNLHIERFWSKESWLFLLTA